MIGTSVGVTVVFLGAIHTKIAQNSGMSMPANADAAESKFKMTEPGVAAMAMADAIEKNKTRLCIGSDAKLMDRLSRLNPVFAANLIAKPMASLLK